MPASVQTAKIALGTSQGGGGGISCTYKVFMYICFFQVHMGHTASDLAFGG